MLYSIDGNKYIRDIPYKRDFDKWRSRLTDFEYQSILSELSRLIEGDEIHTSSWIPGSDWSGTVYDPIYQKACDKNPDAAAMCFGLFLWIAVQKHPEVWSFGRYEKEGIPNHVALSGRSYAFSSVWSIFSFRHV